MFLFVRGFGLDFLHASASAKVVNAAANVAAILLFGLTGELYWLLGLAMAACNVTGAQVGSHLAIRRGSGFVRVVFLLVVGSLIAKTAWDALVAAVIVAAAAMRHDAGRGRNAAPPRMTPWISRSNR